MSESQFTKLLAHVDAKFEKLSDQVNTRFDAVERRVLRLEVWAGTAAGGVAVIAFLVGKGIVSVG